MQYLDVVLVPIIEAARDREMESRRLERLARSVKHSPPDRVTQGRQVRPASTAPARTVPASSAPNR